MRVTTPFCKAAVTHALAGITVLLENDDRIGATERTMRQVDADPNPIVRFSRWQELNREYAELRTAAASGKAAVRRLKAEAAGAPGDDQREALRALANALDGALARQNKIGDVVGRLAQYIDNHPPADEASGERAQFERIIAPPGPRAEFTLRTAGTVFVGEPLATVAKRDADEVVDRKDEVARDENDAAARIDPAFNGC